LRVPVGTTGQTIWIGNFGVEDLTVDNSNVSAANNVYGVILDIIHYANGRNIRISRVDTINVGRNVASGQETDVGHCRFGGPHKILPCLCDRVALVPTLHQVTHYAPPGHDGVESNVRTISRAPLSRMCHDDESTGGRPLPETASEPRPVLDLLRVL
jgi:hypothetical protein